MTNKTIKIKIQDNFLKQEEFDKIQEIMLKRPYTFPWYLMNAIDYLDDEDKFQFVHIFYENQTMNEAESFPLLAPRMKIINPFSIIRIKANLLMRTPEIIENSFHIDINDLTEEKLKHWTTSIFYVNTNNGYTKFEDGTKIECIANRMITFPANIKHAGSSCTDSQTKVLINFNYFTFTDHDTKNIRN